MPALIIFGRILFAVLFIYSGATKLFDIQATAAAVAAKVIVPAAIAPYTAQLETATGMQLPQLLAIISGAWEILAGLMIALNVGVRFFSILTIIYVALVTHDPALARAAALVHVSSTERFVRRLLAERADGAPERSDV